MRRLSQVLSVLLLLWLVLVWGLLETLQFKLTALALVAGVFAVRFPFLIRHRRAVRRLWLGALLVGAVGTWLLLPPRRAEPEARIQSVVLDARGQRQAFPLLPYLANLVPEAELIRVSTLAKGWLPFPAGGVILQELRELDAWDNAFVREYRLLRARGIDRHTHAVAFFQLLQQRGYYRELRHFVLLRPEKETGPVPLVIFLHGYMGNFQLYSGYLAELEDCAVLLPSTPDLTGVWSPGELARVMNQLVPEVERHVRIDRGDVHLIGLSNGGSGVNVAASTHARPFKSLTFLSTKVQPVPEGLGRDKPLGILYGQRDHVSGNNQRMARELKARGYPVKAHGFAGERHFVMLTRREEVLGRLREVMGLTAPAPSARRGAR